MYVFYMYIKFEVSLNNFPSPVSDSFLPEEFVLTLLFPTVKTPLLHQLGLPVLPSSVLVLLSLLHLCTSRDLADSQALASCPINTINTPHLGGGSL